MGCQQICSLITKGKKTVMCEAFGGGLAPEVVSVLIHLSPREGSDSLIKGAQQLVNEVSIQVLTLILFSLSCFPQGGGQCPCGSHPFYHERSARLPHLLAHLQHHGSEPLCWQVWEVHQ